MQLPPTVISVNKKKEKKLTTSATEGGKTSLRESKGKAPPTEGNSDNESSDEAKPDGSGDEDSSGLTADPDAPLKIPVRDPHKAEAKPVLRPPRSLEMTLFERLEKMYGPGIKRMLTVQYRCVCFLEEWLTSYLRSSLSLECMNISPHFPQKSCTALGSSHTTQ